MNKLFKAFSSFFFFLKILWMDWNSVCRSKEVEGLGVRRINEFNYVLLGKWCW